MENEALSSGAWFPQFWDYLYASLTNSTAFSPTDTLLLTIKAKMIMSAQSLVSLTTIAIVGSRAVNILTLTSATRAAGHEGGDPIKRRASPVASHKMPVASQPRRR